MTGDFPPEIRSLAASVCYDGLIRNRLCSKIYDCLMAMFEHLTERSVIEAYRKRSMMLNRRIAFTFNAVALQGVATDINDAGNLIVRCDSGDTITLVGGEVSFGSDNI
ncbi:MAG: hypothetical protein EOM14_06810 [Clostridia bacterium]|nr:hypothetical protein [Clostridia bacterium]